MGEYRVVEEIGRGGMAIVYKAWQKTLDRGVALKILPEHLVSDGQLVQRFMDEAKTAASLNHPNIVKIYDVGVGKIAGVNADHPVHYISMEYLEGRPLNEVLAQGGPLPPERAMRIARQVADALDYAHQREVIHRDIKPSNIIVGPRDHVTLTDFGIARAAHSSHLTRTGSYLGTPAYMSPEQASGKPPDSRSDLYSLGIVIYQMLCGEVPYDAETPVSILLMHIQNPIPSVRKNRSDVPGWLDSVIQRALAKDPAARYQRGSEMVRDLDSRSPGGAKLVSAAGSVLNRGSWRKILKVAIGLNVVFLLYMLFSHVNWRPLLRAVPRKEGEPAPVPTRKHPGAPVMPGLEHLRENSQGYHEYRNPKDGSVLILIPEGEFVMGSPQGEGYPDEHPQHRVYLDAYLVYKYEVTNEQFAKFVTETGYQAEGSWKDYALSGREKHPVIMVSWNDAVAYCHWAGVRLPTEAEWEKAARGADGRQYPWGNGWDSGRCNNLEGPRLSGMANLFDGRGTLPVGSFPGGISPYGVHDMSGNVWEWCQDWYAENYYQHSPDRNPTGPATGEYRVLRGGSWSGDSGYLRCAARGWDRPTFRGSGTGFRCARVAH